MLWHLYSPKAKLALAKRNDPEQRWCLTAPEPNDVLSSFDPSLAEHYLQDIGEEEPCNPTNE